MTWLNMPPMEGEPEPEKPARVTPKPANRWLVGGLVGVGIGLVMAIILLVVLTTHIGAATGSGSAVNPDSPDGSDVDVATGSPEPQAAQVSSFSATDVLGYTVALGIQVYPVSFSSSILNARPGFTVVSGNGSAGGAMTNTTPGRATSEIASYAVLAMYDLSSPVCTLGGVVQSKAGCYLGFGGLSTLESTTAGQPPLGPDESEQLVWASENSSWSVAEADGPAFVNALNSPVGYVIRYASSFGELSFDRSCDVFITGDGTGSGFDITLVGYPEGFSCT